MIDTSTHRNHARCNAECTFPWDDFARLIGIIPRTTHTEHKMTIWYLSAYCYREQALICTPFVCSFSSVRHMLLDFWYLSTYFMACSQQYCIFLPLPPLLGFLVFCPYKVVHPKREYTYATLGLRIGLLRWVAGLRYIIQYLVFPFRRQNPLLFCNFKYEVVFPFLAFHISPPLPLICLSWVVFICDFTS